MYNDVENSLLLGKLFSRIVSVLIAIKTETIHNILAVRDFSHARHTAQIMSFVHHIHTHNHIHTHIYTYTIHIGTIIYV